MGACGRAPASAQVQQAKRKDAEAQSRREIKFPSPSRKLHLCGSAALRLGVRIPCARFNAAIHSFNLPSTAWTFASAAGQRSQISSAYPDPILESAVLAALCRGKTACLPGFGAAMLAAK